MHYYLQHPYLRIALLAIASDVLALGTAALTTWLLVAPPFSPLVYSASVGVGAVLCFLALATADAYHPEAVTDASKTVNTVVNTMALAFVASLVVYFAIPLPRGAVGTLAITSALYFPMLVIGRVLLRLPMASLSRRAVIIGNSDLGIEIADQIIDRNNIGIELVGFLLGEDADSLQRSVKDFPVLGQTHHLEKVIAAEKIRLVIVASQDRRGEFPADALMSARAQGVEIVGGTEFLENMIGRVVVDGLRPSYLIFSPGFRTHRITEALRRAMDLAVATIGLLIASPVLAAAAVAIRLDSPGPILFSQQRVGHGGRLFDVLKLRTMFENAEELSGPQFATQLDPRITRVGRILRMTRIDEVPQYWNVIRGDMSIVGPRPERPEFVEILSTRYPMFWLRQAQKPGLTGWAQVRAGYINEIEDYKYKLGLDLYYLKHRSLLMDLLIIFRTVKTVLLFRGL